ncbi:MAG: methyl-accepting chemotaxis protein [Promethearchaeota archaeon]
MYTKIERKSLPRRVLGIAELSYSIVLFLTVLCLDVLGSEIIITLILYVPCIFLQYYLMYYMVKIIVLSQRNVKMLFKSIKGVSQELINMSNTLANITEEVSSSSEEIFKSASESQALVEKSRLSAERLEALQTTLGRLADQTNLLGINANIEATRVGDLGRGFGAVADQVTKLSKEATEGHKKSLIQINEVMSNIITVSAVTESITSATQEQADATNSITELSVNLNESALELNRILSSIPRNMI